MLITGTDISLSIDKRPIFTKESLVCEPGKLTALTGPSGSGKTSLLHSLGLLLTIDDGEIRANDQIISSYNPSRRRKFWRDHAAFVLQDYGIVDDESVQFNVMMKSGRFANITAKRTLEDALERTGLVGRGAEPASHLSGGEKQRLAIARAIYRSASVLFVDEPTASLDLANRTNVIAILTDFARAGATVIVATHDDGMIAACDTRHPLATRTRDHTATELQETS